MPNKIRYKDVRRFFLKYGYSIEPHGSHIVIKSPSKTAIVLPPLKSTSTVSHAHTAAIKRCLLSESDEDLARFEREVEGSNIRLE